MKTFNGFTPVRRDRLIEKARHDPYRALRKPPEPTVCPQMRRGVPRGALAVAGEACERP